MLSYAVHNLAEIERFENNLPKAYHLYCKSLEWKRETFDRFGSAFSLEGCGHIAAEWGDIESAIMLFSKAAAIRTRLGTPLLSFRKEEYERAVEALRIELGEEDFVRAWAAGEARSLSDAVAEACAVLEE